MYAKYLVLPILLLCVSTLSAQTAVIKLSSETMEACGILTIDLTGCEGGDVVLTSLPPGVNMKNDTGGNLVYAVPTFPGDYLFAVTVTKGTTWSQAYAFLTVTAPGAGPVDPPPVDPPLVDPIEDRYGLVKASKFNIPSGTDQASRTAMRDWHLNFAKEIETKKMKNKEIFAAIKAASEKPPWTKEWQVHYNNLQPIFEDIKLVLPVQWVVAYRDIAKGIMQ